MTNRELLIKFAEWNIGRQTEMSLPITKKEVDKFLSTLPKDGIDLESIEKNIDELLNSEELYSLLIKQQEK